MSMIGGQALPVFAFAQTGIKVPDTLGEAKEQTQKVGKEIVSDLPGVIENIWDNEVLPVWRDMLNWTKETLWGIYIFPFFDDLWKRTMVIVGKEAEKRKPIIGQELEKEKQEIKQDLRNQSLNAGKSLWQRFKELLP